MSFITTSSASFSNFQFILDAALDNYTKQTGIDITKHPSADKLQNIHSPKVVIQLLLEREAAFKDYRNKHHKLINFLHPIVQVVHAFAGSIGEAAGSVSARNRILLILRYCIFTPRFEQAPFHPSTMIFIGIDVLLSVRDALLSMCL
jgi:hypothetical protein